MHTPAYTTESNLQPPFHGPPVVQNESIFVISPALSRPIPGIPGGGGAVEYIDWCIIPWDLILPYYITWAIGHKGSFTARRSLTTPCSLWLAVRRWFRWSLVTLYDRPTPPKSHKPQCWAYAFHEEVSFFFLANICIARMHTSMDPGVFTIQM